MLIPLGVDVVCREGEFTVAASAWFYKLRLYPAKKKAEESEGKTEADVENEDKPKKSFDLGFALDDWLKLIKVALSGIYTCTQSYPRRIRMMLLCDITP